MVREGEKKKNTAMKVLSLYHGSHMDIQYSFSLHSEDQIAKTG